MSVPTFADYVRIEQVRALEVHSGSTEPKGLDVNAEGYDSSLLQRAQELISKHDWRRAIEAPARWYAAARYCAVFLVCGLGVLAVLNALTEQSVNVYWLLLVLLGFNFISLALWCFGILFGSDGLTAGTVGQLPLTIQRVLSRVDRAKDNGPKRASANAWLQAHFTSRLGVWNISALTHYLWLMYLLAGVLSLVVVLSVKQYDFYWGSTLLGAEVFTRLTEWMAAPFHFLGMNIDSAALVAASQQHGETFGAELRKDWASFILMSLLIYGLLPRALVYVFSVGRLKGFQVQYRPDFYLPYYVTLRDVSGLHSGAAEVVDPDERAQGSAMTIEEVQQADHTLPQHSLIVGVELRSAALQALAQEVILQRADALRIEATLSSLGNNSLIVLVDMSLAPDRGVRRSLKALAKNSQFTWLVVHTDSIVEQNNARLGDWFAAAKEAGIDVERICVGDAVALLADTTRPSKEAGL